MQLASTTSSCRPRYNSQCHVSVPDLPHAEAAHPGSRLPPGLVQHLKKLAAQVKAAGDFLSYLNDIGESASDAIKLAQEAYNRALSSYQTARQSAIEWADSEGEREEVEELEGEAMEAI
jgi:hypothetical protein